MFIDQYLITFIAQVRLSTELYTFHVIAIEKPYTIAIGCKYRGLFCYLPHNTFSESDQYFKPEFCSNTTSSISSLSFHGRPLPTAQKKLPDFIDTFRSKRRHSKNLFSLCPHIIHPYTQTHSLIDTRKTVRYLVRRDGSKSSADKENSCSLFCLSASAFYYMQTADGMTRAPR